MTSIILYVFGIISILIGVIKLVKHLNNKEYTGYCTARGCVVKHVLKDNNTMSDSEEFGNDAINYDEDDAILLSNGIITNSAGIVEFLVKNKKYHILDNVNDTNSMPIGKEVIIKYNPENINDAFVIDEFDGTILFVVGAFLNILGIIVNLI